MADRGAEARQEQTAPADTLALLGGHVALDFANTVGWHASVRPRERLTSYEQFVRWTRHAGLLRRSEASVLERVAAAEPWRAEAVLRRARVLREALYRVATAATRSEPALPEDLAHLNAARAAALAHGTLDRAGERYVVRWAVSDAPEALVVPLWHVAAAIGDLLASDDMRRLRQCAGDPCGWLFLDRSRNRSRRWCSSADCGNRVRVREHLARRRAAGRTSE